MVEKEVYYMKDRFEPIFPPLTSLTSLLGFLILVADIAHRHSGLLARLRLCGRKCILTQCFSTFVRPRPGKFFLSKEEGPVRTDLLVNTFPVVLISYIKLT